jgi:hypothetical protein
MFASKLVLAFALILGSVPALAADYSPYPESSAAGGSVYPVFAQKESEPSQQKQATDSPQKDASQKDVRCVCCEAHKN